MVCATPEPIATNQYRKDHFATDGGAEADRFITLLMRAAEQTAVPFYVILTMRSDYLGSVPFFGICPKR
jgi:hypothetical protein